jgi:hypothetical protein
MGSKHSFSTVVVVAVWLAGAVAGFAMWSTYDATPGEEPAEPEPTDGPRLVVFLHPHCPCSRATLREFATVLPEVPAGVPVEVILVQPPGAEPGWEAGPIRDLAAELPDVVVTIDRDGTEAAIAGVTTSGHVVYTNAAGEVKFSGGITRSRGGLGDSSGKRALIAALHGEAATATSPTFGCSLLGKCSARTAP